MRIGRVQLTAGRAALVVSVIALVFALAGGAIGKKKHKGFKLKDGSVTTPKLADGAVTSPKLAQNEQSQGFVTHQTGTISLPGGADTTVATLNLPAGGKYVVIGHASAGPIGGTTPEVVTCTLQSNGTAISQGSAASISATGFNFSAEPVAAGIADGGSVTLNCSPDRSSSAKERVIVATRVGTAHAQ